MNIKHTEDEDGGIFFIEENGNQLAEMVYKKEKGKMIIEHTEVDESLRGQNVGLQLVEHGVQYAREQHLKVLPYCTFAKKVIDSHKELQDVL